MRETDTVELGKWLDLVGSDDIDTYEATLEGLAPELHSRIFAAEKAGITRHLSIEEAHIAAVVAEARNNNALIAALCADTRPAVSKELREQYPEAYEHRTHVARFTDELVALDDDAFVERLSKAGINVYGKSRIVDRIEAFDEAALHKHARELHSLIAEQKCDWLDDGDIVRFCDTIATRAEHCMMRQRDNVRNLYLRRVIVRDVGCYDLSVAVGRNELLFSQRAFTPNAKSLLESRAGTDGTNDQIVALMMLATRGHVDNNTMFSVADKLSEKLHADKIGAIRRNDKLAQLLLDVCGYIDEHELVHGVAERTDFNLLTKRATNGYSVASEHLDDTQAQHLLGCVTDDYAKAFALTISTPQRQQVLLDALSADVVPLQWVDLDTALGKVANYANGCLDTERLCERTAEIVADRRGVVAALIADGPRTTPAANHINKRVLETCGADRQRWSLVNDMGATHTGTLSELLRAVINLTT